MIECLGWALRRLGGEKWLVKILQSMYRSDRRANATFSNNFLVQVGLHQCQVLSPSLFIIVLEVLSREIRSGCLNEFLHPDNLTLFQATIEGLKGRLEA